MNNNRKTWRIIAVATGFIFLFSAGIGLASPRQSDEFIHFDTTTISFNDSMCDKMCVSRVIQAPSPFRYAVFEASLGAHFDVRLFDDSRWLDWTPIIPEEDRPNGAFADKGSYLFVVHQGRAFQIRSASRVVEGVNVITYSLPNPSWKLPTKIIRMAANTALPSLPLISRLDWLDPSIELQNSRRDQLWKSDYATVKKIVIHHTAASVHDVTGDGIVNDADYREAVRGIYSYHTYSQKWGDIGYNYIIDPSGKIWEGRFGGDGAVAGHAYRSKQCTKYGASNISLNEGSMGIAMLGTFSSDTPSFSSRDSLAQLIAQKSWEFDIDPSSSGYFIDGNYPNVVAHRDIDCTECPGNALYPDMPLIVQDATAAYSLLNKDVPHTYAAEKITVAPSRVEMKKGDSVEVSAMFWNIGTTTWRGYGDAPVIIASSEIKNRLASLEALHLASIDKKEITTTTSTQQPVIQGKLTMPNVEPRHVGTFMVKLADPPDELISHQSFTLALGQKGWVPSSDVSVEVVNTGMELAALRTEGDPMPEITDEPGRKITIHFTNKGTATWKKGDVALTVQQGDGSQSELKDSSWKKKDGQFTFDEKEVVPGDEATFSFLVSAPHLGLFQETTQLMAHGKKISGSDYAPIMVRVSPAYEAEVVGMKYTPAAFVKGNMRATITLKNTSTREWKKAALGARAVDGKSTSPFRSAKWKSALVAQALKVVKPGQTLTFTVPLSMPSKSGLYRHTLSLTNGAQKIYLKSGDEYIGSIDQEVRVDPLPKKKRAVKRK